MQNLKHESIRPRKTVEGWQKQTELSALAWRFTNFFDDARTCSKTISENEKKSKKYSACPSLLRSKKETMEFLLISE